MQIFLKFAAVCAAASVAMPLSAAVAIRSGNEIIASGVDGGQVIALPKIGTGYRIKSIFAEYNLKISLDIEKTIGPEELDCGCAAHNIASDISVIFGDGVEYTRRFEELVFDGYAGPPNATVFYNIAAIGHSVNFDSAFSNYLSGEGDFSFRFSKLINVDSRGEGNTAAVSVVNQRSDGYYFISYTFEPYSSVPEPYAWFLMIFGLGAVGSAMRLERRRSRSLPSLALR